MTVGLQDRSADTHLRVDHPLRERTRQLPTALLASRLDNDI